MKIASTICLACLMGIVFVGAGPSTNVSSPARPNPTPSPATMPGSPSAPTVTAQPGAAVLPNVRPNANIVTPQEWQKLSVARAAALKANPALMQKAAEISAKMRDFQQKLDAAIIRTDPNVAPTIAQIERGGAGQRPPFPPQIPRPNSPSFPPATATAPASTAPGH